MFTSTFSWKDTSPNNFISDTPNWPITSIFPINDASVPTTNLLLIFTSPFTNKFSTISTEEFNDTSPCTTNLSLISIEEFNDTSPFTYKLLDISTSPNTLNLSNTSKFINDISPFIVISSTTTLLHTILPVPIDKSLFCVSIKPPTVNEPQLISPDVIVPHISICSPYINSFVTVSYCITFFFEFTLFLIGSINKPELSLFNTNPVAFNIIEFALWSVEPAEFPIAIEFEPWPLLPAWLPIAIPLEPCVICPAW